MPLWGKRRPGRVKNMSSDLSVSGTRPKEWSQSKMLEMVQVR